MANYSTVNRRQFLMSLCGIPSTIAAAKPQPIEPARQIPSEFPGKPEYWFGDAIAYTWCCEDDNRVYEEYGEVMGVCWNPDEGKWMYAVKWTGTNFFTERPDIYPNFEERLADGKDLQLRVT